MAVGREPMLHPPGDELWHESIGRPRLIREGAVRALVGFIDKSENGSPCVLAQRDLALGAGYIALGAGHIRRYRDGRIANTPKATKPSATRARARR